MGSLFQIGRGFATKPDAAELANCVKLDQAARTVDFILNFIPESVIGALADGDILQVLLFAILFGFSLRRWVNAAPWPCRAPQHLKEPR